MKLEYNQETVNVFDLPLERTRDVLAAVLDHLGMTVIKTSRYRYGEVDYSVTTETVEPYKDYE